MKKEYSQSFRYYKSVIVLNRYFEKIGKLNLPGWWRPPNMFNGGSAAPLQSAYDSRSFCRETSYYSEKGCYLNSLHKKLKMHWVVGIYIEMGVSTLSNILGQVESMHTLICFSSGIWFM